MSDKVPNGWKECKLGRVIELLYGKGLREQDRKPGNIPVYGSNGIVGCHNEYLVKGPGIIIGRKGSVGEVKYSPVDFFPIDTTYYVSLKEEMADIRFMYYFLLTLHIDEMNSHSAVPGLNRNDVYSLDVTVPPLPEQRAIASVLSSLDDKIDLLHRENKTLEAMAETLFRQWFIEEAKDEWEKGVIPDEFDFTMGLAPPGESYNEEGIGVPLYQGNADFQFRFPKKRVYTTDPKRFAEKYDALISVRAPVGTINMADDKCCIGRGIAAFRYKNNNSFYTYTYYKLRSLMWEIQQFNDEGTVFGSINKRDFESFEIVIPPFNVIVQFQNFAKPLDDKIIVNSIQIRTLEKLRDTLLPKLMSGEVRVKYEEEEMASCRA